MEVAKIWVSGVYAGVVKRGLITKGITGAQVRLEFTDPLWNGLTRTVVFRGGGVTKDILNAGEVVTVPVEVVSQAEEILEVGVYGTDAEQTVVIPTIWANLGLIQDGAEPSGDDTTDPALPVWAQLQEMIGDLQKLETQAKNDLVAAVNEALKNGGGSVDEETIEQLVEAYLEENPPGEGSGEDGKSAYEYAVEGGYTGTEEEFAAKLAEELPTKVSQLENDSGFVTGEDLPENPLVGSTAELTPTDVLGAIQSGRPIYLTHTDSLYGQMAFNGVAWSYAASNGIVASVNFETGNTVFCAQLFGLLGSNTWGFTATVLAKASDIPTKVSQFENDSGYLTEAPVTSVNGKTGAVTIDIPASLKNPNALTINGASYDGSEAVDVTEQINALIEEKLAEITSAEEVAF